MIKTIELGRNNLARIKEQEPFLLPDKLILSFATSKYDLSNAFVSFQNGKIKEQQKLTNNLIVDESLLFEGMLNIAVHLYHEGKCVKSWYCLPLEIKETKHGTMAFDKLNEIEKKLDYIMSNFVAKEQFFELRDFCNTLGNKHNEVVETVSEIKEKIKEI